MTEPAPMMAADVLRKARALIAPPGQWTSGAMARRENGIPVIPSSPDARQWCAVGACKAVGGPWRTAVYALEAAAHGGGCDFRVTTFNDAPDTTEAEVLALYDAAIILAEQWALGAAADREEMSAA